MRPGAVLRLHRFQIGGLDDLTLQHIPGELKVRFHAACRFSKSNRLDGGRFEPGDDRVLQLRNEAGAVALRSLVAKLNANRQLRMHGMSRSRRNLRVVGSLIGRLIGKRLLKIGPAQLRARSGRLVQVTLGLVHKVGAQIVAKDNHCVMVRVDLAQFIGALQVVIGLLHPDLISQPTDGIVRLLQILCRPDRALDVGILQSVNVGGDQRLLGRRQVIQHLKGIDRVLLLLIRAAAGQRLHGRGLVLGDDQLLARLRQGVPRLRCVFRAHGLLKLLDGVWPIRRLGELLAQLQVIAISRIDDYFDARLFPLECAQRSDGFQRLVHPLGHHRRLRRPQRAVEGVAGLHHITGESLTGQEARVNAGHCLAQRPGILQVNIPRSMVLQRSLVGIQFALAILREGGELLANLSQELHCLIEVQINALRAVGLDLGILQIDIRGRSRGHGLPERIQGRLAGSRIQRRQSELCIAGMGRIRILGEIIRPTGNASGSLPKQELGKLQVGAGDKKYLYALLQGRQTSRRIGCGRDRSSG